MLKGIGELVSRLLKRGLQGGLQTSLMHQYANVQFWVKAQREIADFGLGEDGSDVQRSLADPKKSFRLHRFQANSGFLTTYE